MRKPAGHAEVAAAKQAAKQGKQKKPGKLPSALRKPIPDAVFEKKFARMLEQPEDIAFFRAGFERVDGSWRARAGLDAAAVKRLGKLAKAIKANRGLFKAGPIIALALAGGGAIVFGSFFMNPLLEKAVEAGLSSAFGAKAEVDGLRFSPLGMSMSMARVAVADRDEPMTNLFETGRLALRLDPAAAFRGKVYIVEAVAESMATGTARSESGALPGRESPVKPDEPAKEPAPPLVDFSRFDAKALLEREKASLASTAAYAEAGAAYDEAAARWTGRVESSGAAVAGLKASSSAVLAIDPKKLTKAEDVAKAVAEVKKGIESLQAVTAEAKAVSSGIAADAAALKKLQTAARAALAEDLGYLKSFVDPRSGTAMAALEPSVRAMLSDKAERLLHYAGRAWEVLRKLGAGDRDADAADPAEERPALAARGRDVRFPSTAYPSFRLGLFRTGFSVSGTDWLIEIREASSQPALVAEPTRLLLRVSDSRSTMEAAGLADLRTEGAARWECRLSADGVPLDLGSALADAGLDGFSAAMAGSGDASGSADGAFLLRADLVLSGARVASPSGTFGTAFSDALSGADAIRAGLGWERVPGGEDSFSLTTNLDSLVMDALAAVAKRYADKAMAEVEAQLRSYAAGELEGKLASADEMDDLLASAKGDELATERLKADLDRKLKDLEARGAALGAGVLQGLGLPGLPAGKP